MPSTYSSQAQTGYLGTASITMGSPATLTQVVEVKHINFPKFTIPKVNRTHLLSPNTTEEYVPGIMDPGVVDISGNFIGDATHAADIDALAQAQTVFAWQFTMPVQNRTKTCTFAGNGFIVKNDVGPVEPNRIPDFNISIQSTGYTTVTIA